MSSHFLTEEHPEYPNRNRNDNGFTLIEVVVATVLLVLVSVATMLTLIPVTRQNRISRESEIALTEARTALERIHATPFTQLLTTYPPGTVVAIESLTDGQFTVSYEDTSIDPLLIQLDLQWTSEDQGTVNRSFYTARTE